MIARELLAELASLGPVREDEPMARHTTFGIGGPAEAYFVADSTEALAGAMSLCHRHETRFFLLGSGSNILVGDAGIKGVTIENRATQIEGPHADDDEAVLEASSGAILAALARNLARQGWAGLEWAAGIPGTVGGAVVYNAGAYGGCLADILLSVRIANGEGERQLPATELGLTYRGSSFTRGLLEDKSVLSATFRLLRDDAARLAERVSELDRRRLAAQPRGRNAGSVFKNTPEHPAWRLIDEVGLRGHRIGDAVISPKHANFIVNTGRARASDVAALIEEARERVLDRFGLRLELEVALVGEGF